MAYKSYKEKFLDPRWQKKRLEILQRDNFQCRLCEDKESTLHVHHVEYLQNRDPWDYDGKYLWTLCDKCHQLEHMYDQGIKDHIHDMRIEGLPNAQIAKYLREGFEKYIQFRFVESLCIDPNHI